MGRKEGPGEGNHTEPTASRDNPEEAQLRVLPIPTPPGLAGIFGNKGARGFGHRQSRFYGAGASTLGSRSCLVVEIFLCPPSTVTASAPPRMPWGLCTGRGEPAVRSPSLPAGKSGSEGERDAGRPPGPFWAL